MLSPCYQTGLIAGLPSGGFVATCMDLGTHYRLWKSTPGAPMNFTQILDIDRTMLGVSVGSTPSYALLTLADESVIFIAASGAAGVRSFKLAVGATAFAPGVQVAAASNKQFSLAASHVPGKAVLAFGDDDGVRVASTTDGTAWTLTPGLASGTVAALSRPAISLDTAGNAYVAGIAKTFNGSSGVAVVGKATGATWASSSVVTGNFGTVYVAASPDGQTLLVHNGTNQAWVSNNGGTTFPTLVDGGFPSSTVASIHSSIFSDGSHGHLQYNGLWCTSANLSTWSCDAGTPGSVHYAAPVGQASFASDGTVWASGAYGLGKVR